MYSSAKAWASSSEWNACPWSASRNTWAGLGAPGLGVVESSRPRQQRLNFLPLPQGQGALRRWMRWSWRLRARNAGVDDTWRLADPTACQMEYSEGFHAYAQPSSLCAIKVAHTRLAKLSPPGSPPDVGRPAWHIREGFAHITVRRQRPRMSRLFAEGCGFSSLKCSNMIS